MWEPSTAAREKSRAFALRSLARRTSCSRGREAEISEFVRVRLARFKAPKHVVFGKLPKTSTGKIQKFVLRDRAWAGAERRIQ
ncbi:hypothetical protein ACFRCI_15890 [Streptomyces sp. NPDC056638]|uniref:hypothetical protein n=1 Tax=Streptomyces sp. NPDC056638 TaxID=3345887 RepID=UPI0036AE9A60